MTIVVSNLEVDCGDGGVAFYDGIFSFNSLNLCLKYIKLDLQII